MKFKLMSLFAGLVSLTIIAAPLAAQACNEANKDKNNQESNTSIPTESSFNVENNSSSFRA
jgi:hypothetical protein